MKYVWGIVCGGLLTTLADAAPLLECDEPVYAFGTVIGTHEIVHDFILWNRGDDPIVISTLKNCCGVTSTLSSMEIAPGTNAICHAVFDTENREGEQHKQILVASNDQRQPYLDLRITGTLLKPIAIEPKLVRIGKCYADSHWEQRLVVTNNLAQPIQLISVSSTIPGISAEIVETGDRSWHVRLFTEPPMKPGKLRGWIELHCSTGSERIRIIGAIEPVLRIIPETIQFITRSENQQERFVVLKSSDERPFELVTAKLQNVEGSTRIEKAGSGKWRCRLSIKPATIQPHALLLLKTDCATQSELKIPIQCKTD